MGKLIEQKIGRFDQVKLVTTKNVNYLSATPGVEINPRGIWSVAAVFEKTHELLCVRKGIVIRIPARDVLKVIDYTLPDITKTFENLYGQEDKKPRREE